MQKSLCYLPYNTKTIMFYMFFLIFFLFKKSLANYLQQILINGPNSARKNFKYCRPLCFTASQLLIAGLP